MASTKCIFCDIVSGTSPATIVYQDSELIAFNDIKPVTNHHFLIVPKEHYDSINVLNASNIVLGENAFPVKRNMNFDLFIESLLLN